MSTNRRLAGGLVTNPVFNSLVKKASRQVYNPAASYYLPFVPSNYVSLLFENAFVFEFTKPSILLTSSSFMESYSNFSLEMKPVSQRSRPPSVVYRKIAQSSNTVLATRRRHRALVSMKLDLGYGYFSDPEAGHLLAYMDNFSRFCRRTAIVRRRQAQLQFNQRVSEIIRIREAAVRYRQWKLDWAKYQESKARGEDTLPPPLLDPKDYV